MQYPSLQKASLCKSIGSIDIFLQSDVFPHGIGVSATDRSFQNGRALERRKFIKDKGSIRLSTCYIPVQRELLQIKHNVNFFDYSVFSDLIKTYLIRDKLFDIRQIIIFDSIIRFINDENLIRNEFKMFQTM